MENERRRTMTRPKVSVMVTASSMGAKRRMLKLTTMGMRKVKVMMTRTVNLMEKTTKS